jgi:hypothetical protein
MTLRLLLFRNNMHIQNCCSKGCQLQHLFFQAQLKNFKMSLNFVLVYANKLRNICLYVAPRVACSDLQMWDFEKKRAWARIQIIFPCARCCACHEVQGLALEEEEEEKDEEESNKRSGDKKRIGGERMKGMVHRGRDDGVRSCRCCRLSLGAVSRDTRCFQSLQQRTRR